jgi:hypothetical protein
MASSLSAACTPLKQAYDSCFNAWFEGYLEPAVAAPPDERAAHAKQKAEEYEAKCGKVWAEYKVCVQVRSSLCGDFPADEHVRAESCEGARAGRYVGTGAAGQSTHELIGIIVTAAPYLRAPVLLCALVLMQTSRSFSCILTGYTAHSTSSRVLSSTRLLAHFAHASRDPRSLPRRSRCGDVT